ALAPLREREAVTGAVLQRYTILSEQLADEARRIAQRRAELETRLRQIASDGVRERELLSESETALASYGQEQSRLAAEQNAPQAEHDTARAQAEAARLAVTEADTSLREAADALAQLRARRSQAQRNVEDATGRRARAAQQLSE